MAIRREHAGAGAPTSITAGINASVDNWTLTSGAGYPTGAVGPFVCVIDQGLSTEEKVLVTTRSGNSLTGITRGYDNTVAQAHSILASFSHCFSAIEADEANALAVRAPAGSANLVDLTTVQTLTNKTLTSPNITGTDTHSGLLLEGYVLVGGGVYTVGINDRNIFMHLATSVTINATSLAVGKRLTLNNNAAVTALAVNFTGTTVLNSTSTSVVNVGVGETLELLCDGTNWHVLSTGTAKSNEAWTSYTPTFTNVTGGAGNFAYKLVGKTGTVSFDFTAGTATATALTAFSLPSGWTAVARRFSGSAGLVGGAGATTVVSASDTKAQLVAAANFAVPTAGAGLTSTIGELVIEIA